MRRILVEQDTGELHGIFKEKLSTSLNLGIRLLRPGLQGLDVLQGHGQHAGFLLLSITPGLESGEELGLFPGELWAEAMIRLRQTCLERFEFVVEAMAISLFRRVVRPSDVAALLGHWFVTRAM